MILDDIYRVNIMKVSFEYKQSEVDYVIFDNYIKLYSRTEWFP